MWNYTGAVGYVGLDSFTYQLNDGQELSNLAAVSLQTNNQTVVPMNDQYSLLHEFTLATPDSSFAWWDQFGVLNNDNDPDADPLSVVAINGQSFTPGTPLTLPSGAVLTMQTDGNFIYTPVTGFVGQDAFNYTVTDGIATADGVVTIDVSNRTPMPTDDEFDVVYNREFQFPAPGPLYNDNDADGDPLTAVLVSAPANGTLTLQSDGSFAYLPNPGFVGTDSFTYRVHDGAVQSEVIATVTLNVNNSAPVADEDWYLVSGTTSTSVDADEGVLANDGDREDTITAVLVQGPAHGTLVLNSDGSFAFTPGQDFTGEDSFVYKSTDGLLDSEPTTVYLRTGTFARPDEYITKHNEPLAIDPVGGVLGNDYIPENSTGDVVLVSGPSNGTLTLNADGSFTYVPNSGFAGQDSFNYKIVNPQNQESNITTAVVYVTNQTPTSHVEPYWIASGNPLNVDSIDGVLSGTYDADGDAVQAVLVQGPAHGTLTLNADGGFSYTPEAGFTGQDGFWMKPFDGQGHGAPVFVAFIVQPAPTPVLTPSLDSAPLPPLPPSPGVFSAPVSGLPTPATIFRALPVALPPFLPPPPPLPRIPPLRLPPIVLPPIPPIPPGIIPPGIVPPGIVPPVPPGLIPPGFVPPLLPGGGPIVIPMPPLTAPIPDLTPVPGGPSVTISGNIGYNAAVPAPVAGPPVPRLFIPALPPIPVVPPGLIPPILRPPGLIPPGLFPPFLPPGPPAPPALPPLNLNPVRGAVVDLIWVDPWFGTELRVMRTATNDSGDYSFTIRPGAVAPNSLYVKVWSMSEAPSTVPGLGYKRAVAVVNSEINIPGIGWINPLAPLGLTGSTLGSLASFGLGSMIDTLPYSIAGMVPGAYTANTARNVAIGSTTIQEKAFWTFDAATTAARVHSSLNFVNPGWATLAFGSYFNTSFTPPGLEMPLIKLTDFDEFDTIIHEYGHFVQHKGNFFPFTPMMYVMGPHGAGNPFGAPANHPGEGNLRLLYPGTWQRRVDEFAFSEGWASFFSIAAQQLDPTMPRGANAVTAASNVLFISGDKRFGDKDIEDAPPPPANPPINDANFGEDDENTVMRVLWDLFDPVGGVKPEEVTKDRLELGLQNIFNLLVRPAPQQMAPTLTLGDLSRKLLTFRPSAQDKVDVGAVFQLNNVSATIQRMEIGGANVLEIGQANPQLPSFVWQVPQGEPQQTAVHELLDVFVVRIFNEDYSQELTNSGALSSFVGNGFPAPTVVDDGLNANGVPVRPVILSWTPTAAQWNAVKNVLGVKHVVIEGGLFTTAFANYFSGPYWSDAFNFSILL